MNLNAMSDTDAGTSAPPDAASTTGATASAPNFFDSPSGSSVDFASITPDEYKNSEWVQNISKTEQPVFELFKKVDNLEKLMGSRPAIPTAESTLEQKQQFYKALGVPENPTDYTYEPIKYDDADKDIGKYLDDLREGPFYNSMLQVFHQAGLTKEQVQAVVGGFELNQIAQFREQIVENWNRQEGINAEFQKVATAIHGNQLDAVLTRNGELLKALTPPSLMTLLEKVPGESLALFSAVLENFRQKYVKEAAPIQMNGAYAGGLSQDQIVGEMTKIFADPAYGSMDPRSKALENRVAELREQLRLLTQG